MSLIGQLQAKYPFKRDPGVLIDNRKEAKACQISQERRQVKNNTHSQYVDQFKDMVSRNVVSKISQTEMSAYTGPINYITHHEVYKPGSLSTPVALSQIAHSGMDPPISMMSLSRVLILSQISLIISSNSEAIRLLLCLISSRPTTLSRQN